MAIKFGSFSNDQIVGTDQADLLVGLSGDDEIQGKAGNDVIFGGLGNDKLEGGDGVDWLFGGQGNDILIGDKGDDNIFGGRGNDLLIWNNGDGSDRMNGGSGDDKVRVNGATRQGDQFLLQKDGGQAIFQRLNLGQFQLTVDNVETFEINGGGGNDELTVKQLAGTDVEKVVFNGGRGRDVLDATQADVAVVARGGRGNDRLNGGSGDDVLRGERGNDVISGGEGIDELRGGRGRDTLIGDKGNDKVFGGRGNDLLIWNNGDGSDQMNGGAGYDTVQVNGADGPGDEFELSQANGKALFDRVNLGLFTLTNDSIEQFEINGQGGNDSLKVVDLSGSGVEKVIFSGGEGNDTLDARESSTAIEASGGDGNDLLLGGSAVDTFDAGAGNDIVVGQRGNDIARLGEGDDRFIWNNGDGSDRISGGAGFDVTQVNGADGAGDEFELGQVNGQAIFSRLNLGLFTLTNDSIEQFEINGQGGDDSFTVGDLTGSEVQSVVFSGGAGNDFFNGAGTLTPVTVDGGDGDDILIGGAGNDILIGGNGADLLIGGGGNDVLIGGNGPVRIGFDTGAAFDTDDIGIDTIQGFGAETQIVLDTTVFTQLTSLVGGPLSADEFAVVNNAEEAALSDALIVYGSNSGNLYYNANGAEAGFGSGAQFATIEGVPTLGASNFVIQA